MTQRTRRPAMTRMVIAAVAACAVGAGLVVAPVAGSVVPLASAAVAVPLADPPVADDPVADLSAKELSVASATPTIDGGTVVKLDQSYQGIPVLGAQEMVELDANGEVRSTRSETLTQPVADLSIDISKAKARSLAIAAVAKSQVVAPQTLTAIRSRKYIYDPELFSAPGSSPRLGWMVEVSSTKGVTGQQVVIDAKTGAVLLTLPTHHAAKSRAVCDGQNNRTVSAHTVPCASPARGESDGAHAQSQVNSAFTYAGDLYDYLSARFGRDSIDGAGDQLRATVRFCPATSGEGDCPFEMAFWDVSQQQVFLGEGYAAADDIVAHEFMHGFIEHTSELIYYQQSGAINEALADIFGEFVDQANGSDVNPGEWLIGEDLPGGAIRSMSDPTQFGDPDRMSSPLFYVGSHDYGGVHRNAGVANKFAYLLAQGDTFNGRTVSGIGTDKAAAIIYHAALLLTSTSDYPVLARTLRSACSTLTGTLSITSGDCASVDQAILATEMDSSPANATVAQAEQCEAGRDQTTVWSDNLENPSSGNWQASDSTIWQYGSQANAIKAAGGTDNLWGASPSTARIETMTRTQAMAVPANGYLRFEHAYAFESSETGNWDAGVVQYSTDGGATWHDGGSLIDSGLAYGGTTHTSNALGIRSAFVGNTEGFNYGSTRMNLQSLAGQEVIFQLAVASDPSLAAAGWFLDNISLYSCSGGESEAPDPGVAGPFTFSSGSFGSVAAGSLTARTITLTNSGTAPAIPQDISVDGDDVVIVGGTCAVGSPVAPADTCSVVLNWIPQAAGSLNSSLHVHFLRGTTPIQNSTALSGTAVAPVTPAPQPQPPSAPPVVTTPAPAPAPAPAVLQVPGRPAAAKAKPIGKGRKVKQIQVSWSAPASGGAANRYEVTVLKPGVAKPLLTISAAANGSGSHAVKVARQTLIKKSRKVIRKLPKGGKLKLQVKVTAMNSSGAGAPAAVAFTVYV